ncbi:Uncharacterised protein [Bordetella pertussis]|nr:Uncharacterised protein [Bordetella pertussis]
MRAVDGKGVEDRMRDQHQQQRCEQAPAAIGRIGPSAPYQPGHDGGQRSQHQDGMRESAMVGHQRHGVGITHQHVQVRQRSQQAAVQQGLAPLAAPQHRPLDGRSQHDLCH